MAIHLDLTLPPGSSSLPDDTGEQPLPPSAWPCSRWGLPCDLLLPEARWSLTPPFHPYPSRTGGLFSVALSLRSPWADVIRHRALWSPEVPQPIPMKITAAAIKRSQACNYT